jgi:PPOX class probable F420-dependent enzyme
MTPAQAAFLDQHREGRLATVDAAGRPHNVPICFALLDGVFYTPIDEKPKRGDPLELRRVRNILARPDVCLVVDHFEEDWSRLAWIQVRGTAALVTDYQERTRAFAALRARYPQYHAMDLESRPLIRITPRELVSWAASGTL